MKCAVVVWVQGEVLERSVHGPKSSDGSVRSLVVGVVQKTSGSGLDGLNYLYLHYSTTYPSECNQAGTRTPCTFSPSEPRHTNSLGPDHAPNIHPELRFLQLDFCQWRNAHVRCDRTGLYITAKLLHHSQTTMILFFK